MSHPVFERLLYTDCRAGEGRGGGGGFQIQSQSPGMTPALSKLAVDGLLYATQPDWLTNERAVEDFPRGFAHATKDGWGTAQSVYLGKEVNGNRSGNYLSDCLLSTSPEPYGVIRPAQLWDSELWRDETFPTVDCPSYTDFLEPGPLTNDELQDWVNGDARRPELLKRLVSTLEESNGKRVVILADDPGQALTWIAAATILLPMAAALDIAFKVFVNNPNQTTRVMALPKSLYSTIRIGAERSRFVLDAVSSESDDVPVTDRAEFWVTTLQGASDPYDVVEAVDVADQLTEADASDNAQRDARHVAWAITELDEPPSSARPLSSWLRGPKPASAAVHVSAVAKRLIDYADASANDLNWLERQADEGRIEVDRHALRAALLTAEIREAATSLDSATRLSRLDVGDDAARGAESQLVDAMILTASDADVDRLLTIAWRHDVIIAIPPPPEPHDSTPDHYDTEEVPTLRGRLDRFVDQWIAGRVSTYVPERWALSEYLIDELCSRLNVVLQTSSRPALQKLIIALWQQLSRRPQDLRTPLGQQLFSAHLSSLPREDRGRLVEQAVRTMQTEPFDPAELASWQRALLEWEGLDDRTAVVLMANVPDAWPVNEAIRESAAIAAISMASRPDPVVVQALEQLWARGEPRVLDSPAVNNLLVGDRMVREFISIAPTLTDPAHLSKLRRNLQVDPGLLRWRMDELAEIAVNATLFNVGGTILLALQNQEPEVQTEFLDSWAHRLKTAEHGKAAARAYAWALYGGNRPYALQWHRGFFAQRINEFLISLDEVSREQWMSTVDYHLSVDAVPAWARNGFPNLAVNAQWPSVPAPKGDTTRSRRLSRGKGE